MKPWPKFPNAPITEALLDIKVTGPTDTPLDRLAAFQDDIRDEYPARRTRVAGQATMAFDEERGLQLGEGSTVAADGYLFSSKDNSTMVQARRDGYTFNWLKRYVTWEVFRDQARDLWDHYLEVAKPEHVTRIALRYINRINIPLPINDFSE